MIDCKCVKLAWHIKSIKIMKGWAAWANPDPYTHNCGECKHQLACLIDPDCKRAFESK